MPEGPSLVILREEAAKFAGRRVKHVGGNSRLDIQRMAGQRVQALRTWGKHFLVVFDAWDPKAARRKLRAMPDTLVADALLDQDVFAGVGNIIKNEVLFRIRVHPETPVGALSPRKLGELFTQAREYSFDFYRWKKDYVLKKHYQVHTRTECPRCGRRLEFRAKLGRAQRRAFFCGHCQKRYG